MMRWRAWNDRIQSRSPLVWFVIVLVTLYDVYATDPLLSHVQTVSLRGLFVYLVLPSLLC